TNIRAKFRHGNNLRNANNYKYVNNPLLHDWHFFFQAEDGIRDGHVTGVQTCALPISSYSVSTNYISDLGVGAGAATFNTSIILRSEERRVGKECRSGWSAYH